MNQYFVKSSMTTCNKFIVLCFSSLVLLCLCICPAASAWTTNAFGYFVFSYEELDEIWGERWEDYMWDAGYGGEWPGISDWLNSLPEASLIFRNSMPHLEGKYEIIQTNNTSDGVSFVHLDPQRNYLMGKDGALFYLDDWIPTFGMYAVADTLNMVQPTVESLWDAPGANNISSFPFIYRYVPLLGASSHTRVSISAPSFLGYDMECKTYPFAWSGYWAGWAVNVNEFIDNGVNPSIFGESLQSDVLNLVWLTTNRSIFDSFSNINLRVSHRWQGLQQ